MNGINKSKLINFLTLTSILLCLYAAIWSQEHFKWTLTAVYMMAIRHWFYRPSSVIGQELNLK